VAIQAIIGKWRWQWGRMGLSLANFVYVPAARGAITGITYNADYITTNAEGGAYFALLEQSGKVLHRCILHGVH
jgi:hypothetical protein